MLTGKKQKRMVFEMKKTLSLLLAIIIAAVSICTLTICAFADPAEGEDTSASVEASS